MSSKDSDGYVVRDTLGKSAQSYVAIGRKANSAAKPEISAESVWGRRIMVTGAGGSIGSELVRQIARVAPAHLCMIDSSEYNLYQIEYAISNGSPLKSYSACIADIRDHVAMRRLFLRERPDIVFHAAALKHVPLLEDNNVVEAVLTNVLGTKNVLDLCISSGSDFIGISTDKAVNPTSQMGLTKRVAEIYAHDCARRHPDRRIALVRFGNVIGSSGSVVPLFKRQIEAGGPVTVTHPDMLRYLMSIEDAARLSLAAGSVPQRDFTIYVLDMNEPIRILDLAIQMIKAAGKRPFIDIDIAIVGTRPGEKLSEELSYPWEALKPTKISGVRAAVPSFDPAPHMRKIEELLAAAEARDVQWVKKTLMEIVPQHRIVGGAPAAKPARKNHRAHAAHGSRPSIAAPQA
jgi:O-antigen biosynthesis protein WbqV